MVGSQLNCTQGKQNARRDWGSFVFFPRQFFTHALLSEHLEQASCLQALDLNIFERGFRGLYPRGLKIGCIFFACG